MITQKPFLFSKTLKRFQSQSFSSLIASIGSKLPLETIAKAKDSRDRIFTATRTFWLFLCQILMGNISLDKIVQIARTWLLETEGIEVSPNTSAFTKARQRLPMGFLRDVEEKLSKQLLSNKTFHGYHVKLIDGSEISLPDTAKNRAKFPKHSKAGDNSGFPSLKLVGLFDYETGKALEWSIDVVNTADSKMFTLFWPLLSKNDLIVGDRAFCGFAFFAFLLQFGIHMLTRKHQRRKHQKTEKNLGKDDLIVRWEKPKSPPDWLNEDEWGKLPESLLIREVKFSVKPKGFRTTTVTITTTVLDETITAEEWAELYFHRWKVELFLRDIKISLGMDILKGKTPAMVSKEVFVYFLAYNLVRTLMFEAAQKQGAELSKISFKATVTAIEVYGPMLSRAETLEQYEMYYDAFLKNIAYPRCRNRKNRVEPRAIKRRKKNYQLLKGARDEFEPIPHRNRYKKPQP